MVMVLSFNNSKGGCGKTSTSAIISYLLSNHGKKVLTVDGDLQHNCTDLLLRSAKNLTGKPAELKTSLMQAINNNDISQALVHITPNWDLLGNSDDFRFYPQILEQKFKNSYVKRVSYLWTLLAPLADNYDYCILDCSPSESLTVSSLLYGADYSILLLEPTQYGFDGAKTFLSYVQNTLINELKAPRLDVLGVLEVKVNDRSSTDQAICDEANDVFGLQNVFPAYIPLMQRVRRFSITGLNTERYSMDVYDAYEVALSDILDAIKKKENK